ncbi:MAG: membrane protein insertion efficiency factor YidD [Candidatus Aureabacteria bacterium]|nr:membrane protein insertion efficiency factor YidD [Candidatus Auribacterota bacterium]
MMICVYQRFFSPLLGVNCRYRPSCSAYAREAIRIHGACSGIFLAVFRFLRCNPLFHGGYDPVPFPGQKEHDAGASTTHFHKESD